MTENVIALPGNTVPLPTGEPYGELVEMLEGLLGDARSGRLVAFAYASVKRDLLSIGTAWLEPGNHSFPLMAAVSVLQHRVAEHASDQ